MACGGARQQNREWQCGVAEVAFKRRMEEHSYGDDVDKRRGAWHLGCKCVERSTCG
jgi:hypothetical protein